MAQDISVTISSVSIPYPADYAWANHPQRPNTYSPVSKHAPHITKPEATVTVSTSPGYVCHVVFVDQGGTTRSAVNPLSPLASRVNMVFAPNANTAAAGLLVSAFADGLVTFSQFVPTASIGKKYKGASKWQPAPEPVASMFSVQSAKAAFMKPDEIDQLPTPPKGFNWHTNIRGVLFMESGGQILWPHEVFDLSQMYGDLVAFQNQRMVEGVESKQLWFDEKIHIIEEEIERVRVLFKYMESVADGITLNCKAFGDFK